MTSKISFFKLVRDEMHKNSWLLAVQFLVFGVLIPLRALVVMAGSSSRLTAGAQRMELFCTHVGFGHPENMMFILAAGILCALCAFGYVHSPVKLDFFHSLALKRGQLFAVKYLGSVLTFAAAYLGSQLLALLVGGAFGAIDGQVVLEIGAASLQGLAWFLASYSGALLAVMLTGKWLTTVFAIGVLGLYLPMLIIMGIVFLNVFLPTALHSFMSRSELFLYTSPWALCVFQKGSRMGVTGTWPDGLTLCVTAGTAVVLTVISVWLYHIRKTEAADSAIAFPKLEGTVKLLLTIPTAILAALVGHILMQRVVWEVAFLVVFGIVGCMIMEFIYRWDIRQVTERKYHMVITIVIAAVIFFGFQFDVLGYNTYLPKQEELSAMAVKDQWVQISYDTAIERQEREESMGGENSAGEGIAGEIRESTVHGNTTQNILDYLETEDFDLLYPLAENGVSNLKAGSAQETAQIYVKYRTKSGKEIYRTYLVDKELYQDTMDEMMKKRGYREKYYPIFTWEKDYINQLSAWCHPMGELFPDITYDKSDIMEITSSNIDELIAAYRKDLEEMDFKEIWECNQYLEFSTYRTVEYYPLGKQMEHTKEVLRAVLEEEPERKNTNE